VVQDLFIIGDRLRGFLERLSAVLMVPFSITEIDRVFIESETDQVNAKSYCFCRSSRLQVIGEVDDYEPETIRIQIRGSSKHETAFRCLDDEFRLIIGPNGPIH
jgi:hypothetical protein